MFGDAGSGNAVDTAVCLTSTLKAIDFSLKSIIKRYCVTTLQRGHDLKIK